MTPRGRAESYIQGEKINEQGAQKMSNSYRDNTDFIDSVQKEGAKQDMFEVMCYAGGQLSKNMLKFHGLDINKGLFPVFQQAYHNSIQYFQNDNEFIVNEVDQSLSSYDGVSFIERFDNKKFVEDLNKASKDENSLVYSEGEITEMAWSKWDIKDAFIDYLVSLGSWNDIADGHFERQVTIILKG